MVFLGEVFGEVFAAPILTISNEEIRGQVEEELAQKEWQLKNKKNAKSAKRPAAVGNEPEDTVIPVEEVWEIPSDDEDVKGPRAKAAKTDTDKDDQKAAKEAAKKDKEQEAAWRKEIAKAARVLAPLTSVTQNLANAKIRTGNNAELFPDEVLHGIDEAFTKLKDLKDRSMARHPKLFLGAAV